MFVQAPVDFRRSVKTDFVEVDDASVEKARWSTATTALAASQLAWAQQWVPEDDLRRPAAISTRANRKINALWLQQWQSSAKSSPNPDLVEAPPGTDVLKLHEGLRKAESSLGIQLRTGTNGLDTFLFQARVPSVPSPLCSCGRGRQTARHVLIFCPKHAGARHELRDEQGHLPDFSKLLSTAAGLRKSTKWVMQIGIWGQSRGPETRSMAPPLRSMAPSLLLPSTRLTLALLLGTRGSKELTEDALAGGGLYSPEGFPLQTCN